MYRNLLPRSELTLYGLPENTDLSFLRGCELVQVAIGTAQVQFGFEPSVRICVDTVFELSSSTGITKQMSDFVIDAGALLPLLGQTVQGIDWDISGTIRIVFSSGAIVTLTDTSPQYESYQIHNGSQLIVV